jgi:hypothetical protein
MAAGPVRGNDAWTPEVLDDLVTATGGRPPASATRFPDGGAWRVEIPSVEGPRALDVVLTAAQELAVPVHRVSQGSGVTMLTDGEITEMVSACRAERVELALFARPGANWDIGAAAASSAGSLSARSRGATQLVATLREIERAAGLGVGTVLVADEGVMWAAHQLRERGDLPAELQLKVSAMASPANPAAVRVHQLLGADTINVASDHTLHQLAEFRAASDVTLDFYVEAPDNIGGFVRHFEIAELARVAAPIYLKFGLRNAPDVYPAGEQLADMVLKASRERVRRARLGLDQLARSGSTLPMSEVGCRDQPALERFSDVRDSAAVLSS